MFYLFWTGPPWLLTTMSTSCMRSFPDMRIAIPARTFLPSRPSVVMVTVFSISMDYAHKLKVVRHVNTDHQDTQPTQLSTVVLQCFTLPYVAALPPNDNPHTVPGYLHIYGHLPAGDPAMHLFLPVFILPKQQVEA